MPRYDRARFAAYGLPALLSTLALLIYAFDQSFHLGSSKLGLWAALAISPCSLLWAIRCAVRRGRDLGWSALATAIGLPLSLMLMPLGLIFLGLLCFGRSRPDAARFGPAPSAAGGWMLWGGGLLSLLVPWLLLLPFALAS